MHQVEATHEVGSPWTLSVHRHDAITLPVIASAKRLCRKVDTCHNERKLTLS
jgi:hypothetical protein